MEAEVSTNSRLQTPDSNQTIWVRDAINSAQLQSNEGGCRGVITEKRQKINFKIPTETGKVVQFAHFPHGKQNKTKGSRGLKRVFLTELEK